MLALQIVIPAGCPRLDRGRSAGTHRGTPRWRRAWVPDLRPAFAGHPSGMTIGGVPLLPDRGEGGPKGRMRGGRGSGHQETLAWRGWRRAPLTLPSPQSGRGEAPVLPTPWGRGPRSGGGAAGRSPAEPHRPGAMGRQHGLSKLPSASLAPHLGSRVRQWASSLPLGQGPEGPQSGFPLDPMGGLRRDLGKRTMLIFGSRNPKWT
jgi:hypothetical protein